MKHVTAQYSPEHEPFGGALAPPADPRWVFSEQGVTAALEHDIETRFTIGNGLLGVRGSLEEGYPWSRPRTFVAGLFAPSTSEPPLPALLPGPDWLRLHMVIDGAPLTLDAGTLLTHVRTLDVRNGALWRYWRHRTPHGQTVRLHTVRWAALADRRIAGHRAWIVVEHPATVTLQAWVAPSDERLRVATSAPELTVWRIRDSTQHLALASAFELHVEEQLVRGHHGADGHWSWTWQARPEEWARLTRLVAWTRGGPDADPAGTAAAACATAQRDGIDSLWVSHTQGWHARWDASGVEITGDPAAQQAVRFATYHLVAAANPDDEHVSIGARALTGDAYLGHVFWDTELFLVPFYTWTWPAAARALLRYRYHTLPAARAKAAQAGYKGAFYAWESADTGAEATPPWVRGPDGQIIAIRAGSDEQHISADIAYAVWQYWQITGDDPFLLAAGAEIVLETARFWVSRATLGADQHYHVDQVIGPDEYHERIDDNAYTNELARWNIERGQDIATLLEQRWPERWAVLCDRIGLTRAELGTWGAVANGLARRFDPGRNLFEQFAGYFSLEPIDLTHYAERTAPMDVVLGRERTQRSQVIKQADVVMLVALLWDQLTPTVRRANFEYYAARTGHGSSLSPAIHALVAARLGDTELALRYFRDAAAIDLDDAMGNAAQGIHIATLGGLWQAAVLGFGGISFTADGLRCDPHLPAGWRGLRFAVQWRGRQVRFAITRDPLHILVTLEHGAALTIRIGELHHRLQPAHPWVLERDSTAQIWREVDPC